MEPAYATAGDAFGYAVEFQSLSDIRRQHGADLTFRLDNNTVGAADGVSKPPLEFVVTNRCVIWTREAALQAFEHQDLVRYLESIGMRFGADVNAYTGFDQTVYMLQVPTDDPAILERGFEILEDWANLKRRSESFNLGRSPNRSVIWAHEDNVRTTRRQKIWDRTATERMAAFDDS